MRALTDLLVHEMGEREKDREIEGEKEGAHVKSCRLSSMLVKLSFLQTGRRPKDALNVH